MALFTEDPPPNERGKFFEDLLKDHMAAKREPYAIVEKFNAGWASGNVGETVYLTEQEAGLLGHRVQKMPEALAPPPIGTPVSEDDDVPGAPPVMTNQISSQVKVTRGKLPAKGKKK